MTPPAAAAQAPGSGPPHRCLVHAKQKPALEILRLCGAAWLPAAFPDLLLVPALSFVAALQNSSFPNVESWAYNSVMTAGNLRRFADGLYLML